MFREGQGKPLSSCKSRTGEAQSQAENELIDFWRCARRKIKHSISPIQRTTNRNSPPQADPSNPSPSLTHHFSLIPIPICIIQSSNRSLPILILPTSSTQTPPNLSDDPIFILLIISTSSATDSFFCLDLFDLSVVMMRACSVDVAITTYIAMR